MNFIKNGDFRHFFATYFITRAEFDSLKNNFQSQIDQYNSSIDSKIDGAIASYLAGIKLSTVVSETSLLNKTNNLHFRKTLANFGTTPGLGNKTKLLINFGIASEGGTGGSRGSSGHLLLSNGSQYGNSSELSVVGTDEAIYLVYMPSTLNVTKIKPTYTMATTAVCLFFANMITQNAIGTLNNSTCYFQNHTAEIDGYVEGVSEWCAQTQRVYGTLAGSSASANGSKSWSNQDSTRADNFNLVAGGATTDTTFYAVKYDQLNKVGAKSTLWTASYGSQPGNQYVYFQNANSYTFSTRTSDIGNQKMQGYYHYYQKAYWEDFEEPTISTVMNKSYGYSVGLPIFTASDDGEVELVVFLESTKDFDGDDATDTEKNTIVSIKDDAFENEVATIGLSTSYDDAECTRSTIAEWTWKNDKTEYKTKFNVKKNKTYWIKCMPSDDKGGIKATTTKIQLTKEN